jgi:hypothetical protein
MDVDSATPLHQARLGSQAHTSGLIEEAAIALRCGEFRVLGSFLTPSTGQLLVSTPWWCPKSA